jgi:hypothetical protein
MKGSSKAVATAHTLPQFKNEISKRFTDFFTSDQYVTSRNKEVTIQDHSKDTADVFAKSTGTHGIDTLGNTMVDVLKDIKYTYNVPMDLLEIYIRHMSGWINVFTQNTANGIKIENVFKVSFGTVDDKKDKEIAHLTWAFKNIPLVYLVNDHYVPLFVSGAQIRNKDDNNAYYAIGFLDLNNTDVVFGIKDKLPAVDNTFASIHQLVGSYKQFRPSVSPFVMVSSGRYISIKNLTEEVCGEMKRLADMAPGNAAEHFAMLSSESKTNPMGENMLTASDLPAVAEVDKKSKSGTSKKMKTSDFVEQMVNPKIHASDDQRAESMVVA